MNHSQTGRVAVGGVRLLLSALTMAVAAAGCGDDDNNPNAPTNTVGRIQLTASQASLPGQGGDSDITATVFSGAGAPLAAVEVAFTTTSGTLSGQCGDDRCVRHRPRQALDHVECDREGDLAWRGLA